MSAGQFIPDCLAESRPLPNLEASALDKSDHESVATLYNNVLHAESMARESIINETSNLKRQCDLTEPALINIRLVGWFLIALHQRKRLLGDIPMNRVVEDVWGALRKDGTSGIQRKGDQYRRVIRETWTWRCNEPSGRISGYQYTFNDYHDWLEDQAEVEEELGVWDASTIAKFKAFTRDGFACLVTPRTYSDSYARATPSIRLGSDNHTCRLESARIIPHLRIHLPNADACLSAGKATPTIPASVLDLFGLSEVVAQQLAPDGVDHLSNILSLSLTIRHAFESLDIWFDATDHSNEYRVECPVETFREGMIDHPVTFRNRAERVNLPHRSDFTMPLPNAQLLAIHAACAFALNMSGEPRYELVRKRERNKNPYYIALLDILEDMMVDT